MEYVVHGEVEGENSCIYPHTELSLKGLYVLYGYSNGAQEE